MVDTVVNHMAAGSGTGTGGSSYTKYNYPGLYSSYDMDDCTATVSDYTNRANVQNCELVGLADLDTGEEYVRKTIAGYMNSLLGYGVDGFRIDAAKHIPATDLANIKSRLTNPSVYWKQEVIYGAGEAVQPTEYTGNGDVQEFRYAYDLKRVFNNENLAYLKNYGEGWGYMSSSVAGVFVDNHDTERNGSTLNYKDGANYTLANVFMLAYPYGAPDINSGYEWSDVDAGPPNGGTVNACWQDGWKCQHAWPEIKSMVAFRNATRGQSVTDWWDDGNDAIASSRRQGVRGHQPRVGLADPDLSDIPRGGDVLQCPEQHQRHGERLRAVHGDPRREHGTGAVRGQDQLLSDLREPRGSLYGTPYGARGTPAGSPWDSRGSPRRKRRIGHTRYGASLFATPLRHLAVTGTSRLRDLAEISLQRLSQGLAALLVSSPARRPSMGQTAPAVLPREDPGKPSSRSSYATWHIDRRRGDRHRADRDCLWWFRRQLVEQAEGHAATFPGRSRTGTHRTRRPKPRRTRLSSRSSRPSTRRSR